MPLQPKDPNRVRWRWWHLWLFGFCAWGAPQLLEPLVLQAATFSGMLDKSLLAQIAGYLLAALVAVSLVRNRQGGDWSSLGLTFDPKLRPELAQGAGFGLLLLGGWSVIGFAISGGKLEIEPLVKMLLGETSGLGLILAALVVVVGAPVIEEIYYRGMLYEKLARKWPIVAIVLTSAFFVAAHGSIVIPALWLLALGAAIARRRKTLWFTIGAHSAWNLAVLVLALFVLSGSGTEFVAPDSSYTLRYGSEWEDVSAPVDSMGRVDLTLGSTNGSMVVVERVPLPPRADADGSPLPIMKKMLKKAEPGSQIVVPPGPSGARFGTPTPSYEFAVQSVAFDGSPFTVRTIAVAQGTQIHSFGLICPLHSCGRAEKDLVELLETVTFGS
jgi:membrane protease YdiL (CAAX protease family)